MTIWSTLGSLVKAIKYDFFWLWNYSDHYSQRNCFIHITRSSDLEVLTNLLFYDSNSIVAKNVIRNMSLCTSVGFLTNSTSNPTLLQNILLAIKIDLCHRPASVLVWQGIYLKGHDCGLPVSHLHQDTSSPYNPPELMWQNKKPKNQKKQQSKHTRLEWWRCNNVVSNDTVGMSCKAATVTAWNEQHVEQARDFNINTSPSPQM